ncbi:Exopolygalacturonase, partial [Glycine soja]
DSTALAPEPLADYLAPFEIPPADSAEPPSLDNSPSDGSAEYIELYSTLLEYFNLTRYGAVADGRTDSSSAFLAAWEDACSHTGSSTFFVPKGTFFLGPVSFSGPCHNNGSPKIEIMGTLKAPISLNDFPTLEWVVFKNLNGFNLPGLNSKATLDAQGQESWSKAACYRVMKCHNIPTALKFLNVSNGSVRNISLLNSKAAHVSIHKCENIDFSGFNIHSPGTSPNTEGITIIGDDCVAIGPGSTNISVSFVHCGPGHGISVGILGKSSNEKDVAGVHISNCIINGTKNGVRPSQVKLEDVSFENISGTYNTMHGVTLWCSSAVPSENILLANINLNYTKQADMEQERFIAKGVFHDLQVVNSQF